MDREAFEAGYDHGFNEGYAGYDHGFDEGFAAAKHVERCFAEDSQRQAAKLKVAAQSGLAALLALKAIRDDHEEVGDVLPGLDAVTEFVLGTLKAWGDRRSDLARPVEEEALPVLGPEVSEA